MKSLTPNKTRNQVSKSAVISGFFWSNNKPVEFQKKTIKNGIPFIEEHKGIILLPIPESILKKTRKMAMDILFKNMNPFKFDCQVIEIKKETEDKWLIKNIKKEEVVL